MRNALIILVMTTAANAEQPDPCWPKAKFLEGVKKNRANGVATEADLLAAEKQLNDCRHPPPPPQSAADRWYEEEQKQREEEAQVAAKAAAEQEDADNKLRNNPKAMAVAFGAELCMAERIRKSALTEIETEKKYARIGGYENKQKIYALQVRIRRVDEFIARERAKLRTAPNLKGVKPAPCTDRMVRIVIACKSESPPGGCEETSNQQMLRFVATIDDENDDQ